MCAHAQRTGIQIGPGKTTQLWLRPARLFLSNSEFPVCSTPLVFFFVSSRLMKSTRFQPDFWGFPPNNPVSVAPQPSVLSLVVKEVLFLSFTEGTTVWEPNFASISLFHSRSFSLPTRFPSLFCFGVYHTVVGRPVCQPGCGWLAFGGLWSGPSGTRSGRLRAYLSLSPLRRWPALVPLSSNLSIQHSTNNFVTRTCWFGSPMPLGREVVLL